MVNSWSDSPRPGTLISIANFSAKCKCFLEKSSWMNTAPMRMRQADIYENCLSRQPLYFYRARPASFIRYSTLSIDSQCSFRQSSVLHPQRYSRCNQAHISSRRLPFPLSLCYNKAVKIVDSGRLSYGIYRCCKKTAMPAKSMTARRFLRRSLKRSLRRGVLRPLPRTCRDSASMWCSPLRGWRRSTP